MHVVMDRWKMSRNQEQGQGCHAHIKGKLVVSARTGYSDRYPARGAHENDSKFCVIRCWTGQGLPVGSRA